MDRSVSALLLIRFCLESLERKWATQQTGVDFSFFNFIRSTLNLLVFFYHKFLIQVQAKLAKLVFPYNLLEVLWNLGNLLENDFVKDRKSIWLPRKSSKRIYSETIKLEPLDKDASTCDLSHICSQVNSLECCYIPMVETPINNVLTQETITSHFSGPAKHPNLKVRIFYWRRRNLESPR